MRLRWLLLLWLALSCSVTAQPSIAGVYYVETTGSDANSGLFGSPWRTLEFALGHVVAGSEIRMGPGRYSANSGAAYAPFAWAFGSTVTVTSATGNPADVVISGSGGTSGYDFKITGTIERLTFLGVTFENSPAAGVFIGSAGTGAAVHDLAFKDCVFNMGATCNYLFLLSGYSGNLSGLTFTGCRINMTKDPGVGIMVKGANVDSVVFVNNICSVKNGLIRLEGARNSRIDDNRVSVTGVAGTGLVMCYGNTGVVPGLTGTNNSMSRNFVNATGAKYSHVMGTGIGHTTIFDSNIIIAGDIWVKLNDGSRVTNNVMAQGAVELKAATGFLIHNNSLQTQDGTCITFVMGDVTAPSEYGQIINNYLTVSGSGKCYSLLYDCVGDQIVIDYNVFQGNIGDIRHCTGIRTIEAARTAWEGYGIPTNEANSSAVQVIGVPIQIGVKGGG
ncbi:MAG: DUF1565 domain-containing protein [Armatimonadetes bacterium]|nr:DUF1565 domain-containing protein [Armatimonadota bacterium]